MPSDKKDKNLSAVFYDEVSPPRFLTLNQKVIERTFTFLPLVSLFFIASSLVVSAYYRYQSKHREITKIVIKQVPSQIQQEEILNLKKTITELQINKVTAQQEQSQVATKVIPPVTSAFPLVERPPGALNLLDEKQVLIQNFKLESATNKVTVSFDLSNNRLDKQKIKGHILSFLYHKHGVELSHGKLPNNLEKPIPFSFGERFQTERFRPSAAVFLKPIETTGLIFKVFIFAENGDLLAQERWEQ